MGVLAIMAMWEVKGDLVDEMERWMVGQIKFNSNLKAKENIRTVSPQLQLKKSEHYPLNFNSNSGSLNSSPQPPS